MSSRAVRVLAILAIAIVLSLASRAHAGWSADPVQVLASSAHIPQVSAADDGRSGAIVVWQEDNASGGSLRALHLLATGDLDPAWPSAVLVSSGDVKRDALGSIPDGSGGVYVWWLEGVSIYLTHLSSSGAVSPGWPSRGRMAGTLIESSHRPTVRSDGSGGVYVAWLSQIFTVPLSTSVRILRLGPDNTARSGWPTNGRGISNGTAGPSFIHSFDIAPSSEGGLWVVFASSVVADTGGYEPGDVRVRKLGASGLAASGWPLLGVPVGPFNGHRLFVGGQGWQPAPAMRLAAVAGERLGGVFVLYSDVQWDESYSWLYLTAPVLSHLDSSGQGPPRSSSERGALGPAAFSAPDQGGLAAASLRLLEDVRGGVWLGSPLFHSHGDAYSVSYVPGPASAPSMASINVLSSLEILPAMGGGLAIANCVPSGPYGPYQPSAFIGASLTASASSYLDVHPEPVLSWFGDVGLAATEDGGAILVWSQERERFGLFAVRLNPAGQVTDVPPAAAGRADLRARFARGRGVVARFTIPGALEADLALLDVQGRVGSTLRGAGGSTPEAVFPGTATLAPGVYFVRASGGGVSLTRRVVVLR